MKRLTSLLATLLVPAFMLAGVAANPAMAQDKAKDAKAAPAAKAEKAEKAEKGKTTRKVLFENDKVLVFEVTFKPGDEGANIERPFRVTRVMKGGTLMRTYADGKTEKVEWKTGDVKLQGPDKQFKDKNVGKTEAVLYVVQVKEPKK